MIRRGFVDINSRYLHWQALGAGPVIVMLHESPRSSTSLLPLMRHLSDKFCCIAFDTPGYGASDPLPDSQATLNDFADIILEATLALGISKFSVYGTHTGAAIAVQLALSTPQRVTSLLLDGLAIFSVEEQKDMLEHYLIPHQPQWDGSHLMRIWSRIRDQAIFFPFYNRSHAARLAQPNLDLNFMLRTCFGFLESGDHYQVGYRAAICFDGREGLSSITVPARLQTRSHDLLASHLMRAKSKNSLVSLETTPLQDDAWLQSIIAWFSTHPSPSSCSSVLPQHPRRRFVYPNGVPVYVVAGEGQGLTVTAPTPSPRNNGLYGAPDDAERAGWFADSPCYGVNAAANYDPAALTALLGTTVNGQTLVSEPSSFPEPDYDGAFLISTWYAVRDNLIALSAQEGGDENAAAGPQLAALSAGHLALLYTQSMNRL